MAQKTNADLIKEGIKRANEEKIDLTLSTNRQGVIDKIIEENPHLGNKRQSLQAGFSRFIKSDAKAQGKDPAKFVKGSSVKNFDDSIDTPLDSKPVIMNPAIDPSAPVQKGTNLKSPNPYNIQEKQIEAVCDSVFELIRAFDSNIESLDKNEKESIGGLWTPIAQDSINSKRSLVVMAAGATVGTFARKVKKGRKITKAQKEQRRQQEKREDQKAIKKATENKYPNPETIIGPDPPKEIPQNEF